MKLLNKGVIITGAARGIGREIAEVFAQNGADLLLVDILPMVEETATSIRKHQTKNKIITQQMDIREIGGFNSLVKYALDHLGKIDVLINNAGVCKKNLLIDLTEEEWNWHFEINVKGMFFLTKAVVREMIRKGVKGKIINIASIMAKIGEAGFSAYTASKHAILGLSRCLAYEMAPYRISVNAICPGIVDTDMELSIDTAIAKQEHKLVAEVKKRYESLIPLGRYAKPTDIAKTALFLASEESDFITGQAINVCGGMVMY